MKRLILTALILSGLIMIIAATAWAIWGNVSNSPITFSESGSSWTNEDWAYESDNSRAQYTGTSQAWLIGVACNLQIPMYGIVTGIQMEVEGNGGAFPGTERAIVCQLYYDGVGVGIVQPSQQLPQTVDDTLFFGGATNLCDWTDARPANINSALFGFQLRKETGNNNGINIDWMNMTIWWMDYKDKKLKQQTILLRPK